MAEPRKPVDRARKQAAAKATVGDVVQVTIQGSQGSAKVSVLPQGKWGYAWKARAKEEDLEAFIAAVLVPDDIPKFEAVNPSYDDVADFLDAWAAAVGEDLGESRTSQAS